MIIDLLENGNPSDIALATAGGGPAITYGGLKQQVHELSSTLNHIGLGRGDRIAMALPNGIELISSFLAAAVTGTAAPLNPAYKYDEFKFYLEDTKAKALILPPGELQEARQAAGESGVLIVEASVDAEGKVRYEAAGNAGSPRSTEAATADDIALMLHTSGTTSRPKRVPLAHKNLSISAKNVAAWYQLSPDDVALCVMPLFHVHGLVASTLATLTTGGQVVIVPKFNPLSFWATVRDYRATWYSAVPTIHQVLVSRTKPGTRPQGAEQLRFIRSCSAALPPQTMADIEERFGVPILEAYGMTEAAHQMASNPLPPGARKSGSVGLGGRVSICILDEQGQIMPPNTHGEVSIKGPNVFAGYEDNPQANAAAFTNGWFRTGDQGFLDDEGYLTLVGRIKELINRGGEKISPREVDEALLRHPCVSEAVCFGIADRTYGEEVAAAVVLKAPAIESELRKHCESMLAGFKVPKVIYIVEAIPKTPTGKIQRRIVSAEISKKQEKGI